MKTFVTKQSDAVENRKWFVVDAEGMVLGRLATEVAYILRGKHKTIYAPYLDCGDHVIVINADKVILTSDKADRKYAYHHTGYTGHLRAKLYRELMVDKPEFVVEKAVKGMLPKGPLGRQMGTKLKVYAGGQHPHAAQNPEVRTITSSRKSA
ncbi:MAG: 50S ribosomal protein L13 [Acidimicrobiaceae bacterium]|nr:50S ribosomal protein L13 [Acidimicrobiaceae bacterium]